MLPPAVMRFSADGSRLWTAGSISGAKEWDFAARRLRRTVWPGPRSVLADLLPDRGLAAMTTVDDRLWLMDLNTGRPQVVLPVSLYDRPLLSPDGSHAVLCLVSSGPFGGPPGMRVLRWSDASIQEPVFALQGGFILAAFCFSESDFLAVDLGVRLLRFRIGRHDPLWEREGDYWPLTVRPGGTEFLGVQQRLPVCLDAANGSLLREFPRLPSPATAVAWSPDGASIAFALENGVVEIRRATDGALIRTLDGLAGRAGADSLLWSPDERFLLASNLDQLWSWELAAAAPPQAFLPLTRAIHATVAHDGAHVVTGNTDEQINGIDAATGEVRWRRPRSPEHNARSLAASPAGDVLALGRNDGQLELWRTSDGTLLETVKPGSPPGDPLPAPQLLELAWSPDGGRLAIHDLSNRLRICRTDNWNTLAEAIVSGLSRVAFSPNGTLVVAAVSAEKQRILRAADLTLVRELPAGTTVGFRAGGTELVTLGGDGREGVLEVWRLSDGARLHGVQLDFMSGFSALSPDGRVVFTSDSGTGDCTAWEVDTGARLAHLVGEVGVPLNEFHATPDGTRLIAPRVDGSLLAFEIPFFLRTTAAGAVIRLEAFGGAGPFELQTAPRPNGPWEATQVVFDRTTVAPPASGEDGWYRARRVR